jgi:hypothetical protein
MTQFNSIDDILNNSDFDNILVPEPAKISQTKTIDQRLVDSFVEINEFFKENKFAPSSASKDINQRKLNARLESFKTSPDKIIILKEFDQYNLLPEIKEIESIENNYELNEKEENLDIFKLQHITNINRAETDFVARRKPCKDFVKFELLFKECHEKLKSGEFRMVKFSESNLEEGVFYVMKGIIMYLEKFEEEAKLYRGSYRNNRTRIIFENGTESKMLKRSMVTALSNDGKKVVNTAKANLYSAEAESVETGYIYILKSLSTNPEISGIQNLYKIGYSTTLVEERIKNARVDPTYLNADVKIVATFKTIDLNPQKLENLLHRFFADSCLNVLIDDGKGGKLKPREWFIVPLEVIEETINLIINGNITNYRYSTSTEANELNI